MNVAQSPEQRLTFRLLSYWNRIRGSRKFPALQDVQIGEINEMWHFTFTLFVGGDESEHYVQYFGPQLASVFRADYTGEKLLEALEESSLLANTIGFYPRVIETGSPQSESESFFMDGKEVRYRSLIVPFSTDGTKIDYLLGTTNYKIFE